MSAPPAPKPSAPKTEGEVQYLLCRAADCGWRIPFDVGYEDTAEYRRGLHESFCAYF